MKTKDDQQIWLEHQEIAKDNINQTINSLGIPIIKDCIVEVIPKGFIIKINGIEGIKKSKHLILEGSLCVYFSKKVEANNYIGDVSEFVGLETIIDIYIRIGLTDTWLYANFITPIFLFLENNYEHSEIEDYEDELDDEQGYSEDGTDYERINRLATIVAKSKGFNLLKNRDQRKIFAKDVLNNSEEKFEDYELYGIAATSETFYEFGVLPIEVKKQHLQGKSAQEIAKLLGHTKAKIEKALICEVPDIIRKNVE